jgi:HPt (histidine-containing phosphotransfer) domain-containing protein
MTRGCRVLFATAKRRHAGWRGRVAHGRGYIAKSREHLRDASYPGAPAAAETLPELSMPNRWSPCPRWPAVQAEAAVSAGGGLGLLDATALARLRELDPSGNSGLLNRVLQTYTQALERMLAQWHAARCAGDAPVMAHVAHTLKSSSASVGALSLSALCADVEARLRDGRREGLETQLDLLTAEAERILAGLLSRQSSHSGQT